MTTTTELLRTARQKLQHNASWTQYAAARARTGIRLSPNSPDAVSYCMLGAVAAADNRPEPQTVSPQAEVAIRALAQKISRDTSLPEFQSAYQTVAEWNDDERRTHPEVVSILDRAIDDEADQPA